jgi:hypothetical protein
MNFSLSRSQIKPKKYFYVAKPQKMAKNVESGAPTASQDQAAPNSRAGLLSVNFTHFRGDFPKSV